MSVLSSIAKGLGIGVKGHGAAFNTIKGAALQIPNDIKTFGQGLGDAVAAQTVVPQAQQHIDQNTAFADARIRAKMAVATPQMRVHLAKLLSQPAPDAYQAAFQNSTIVNDPNKFKGAAVGVASLALPGARIPGVIEAANPAARLIGSGIIRGAENAGQGAVRGYVEGQTPQEILQSAKTNFLVGAALNTALSPKLSVQAARDALDTASHARVPTESGGTGFQGKVQLPGEQPKKAFVNPSFESAFNKGEGQQIISKVGNTNIELGNFGINQANRKADVGKPDRFSATEISKIFDNNPRPFKASDDPMSPRSAHIAWVADLPNGETRVVYTRKNRFGNEEVINWHKVDKTKNPNYIAQLETFGTPDQIRTGTNSLEGKRSNPLAYGGTDNVSQELQNVNITRPKGTGKILGRRENQVPPQALLKDAVPVPVANQSVFPTTNPKIVTSLSDNTPKTPDLSIADVQKQISKAPKGQSVNHWDTFKQQFLNRYDPIEQMVKGKNVAPSKNPATLLKRLSGGMGIANAKIDNELTPILRQATSLDDFRTLLVAERSNELAGRGIGKSANTALDELRAKVGEPQFTRYQQQAEALRTYQDKLLQEWRDVGGLSDEAYTAIKNSNQKYVPFNRVIDDLESDGFIAGMSDVNQKSQPIKKIKGSDRDIIDPLESVLKNTYDMTKAIEKNRAVKALAELGEFEKIKGVGGFVEPKTPHITFFDNGKKVYYSAPKEIADAIKGINEEHLNIAIQAMALPARLMRAGATGVNVSFAVPNIIRDQLSAVVNSKYGGIPIYDFLSGLASVVKKDDSYKQWLLSGADQAGFFSQDRTRIRRTLGEVTKRKLDKGKYLNPLELARIVGEFSEKGSRVGVFKRASAGAGKEGLTGFDQQLAAMVQSREATVDFARRGSKMKALNAIIPFLNARTQGSLKLIESARTRPLQTVAIGGALVTIPTVALYLHNIQYPDYDEIPDYIKDNNFIIMTGDKDTPFYKIPKGEIGQIFGNPTETFLDFLKQKDRKSVFELGMQLLGTLSPVQSIGDVIPTAAKVPLENIANYDTFRKRNIVSPYQKDLPPELQFDKKTSETAKFVGGKLKVSPAKLEHAFLGLTAGVGKQFLTATDAAGFGKTPATQNLPILDRFMGEQNDLSKSAQKIYEDEEKRKQETARNNYAIKQRIRKGIETNDVALLKEAQAANPDNFKRFVNDILDDIESKNMSPKERAIKSLPKKEQEKYGGLDLLPTTGQPRAGAASGDEDVKEFLKSITATKGKTTEKTQVLNAQLTSYAFKKDLQKWQETANKQIENYQTQLKDTTLDESDKISIQTKIDKLQATADKYKAQKGFTKPKAAKKAKIAKIKKVKFTKVSSRISKAKSVKFTAPKSVKFSVKKAPAKMSSARFKFTVPKLPKKGTNGRIRRNTPRGIRTA